MISIIVPIYNAADYLQACLDSLIGQSEKDLQIILVDDGSTDSSLSIAKEYAKSDNRIALYEQSHSGQSAARNLGLQHATGEFIAFADADDQLEPDWCAQHLAVIGNADYVQSGYKNNGRSIFPRHRYQFTAVWARLYRSEILKGLKFAEGKIYEDILYSADIWLRNAKCQMLHYAGYLYTNNPHSTTSQPHPEARKCAMQALRSKARNTTWRGKAIIWFTIIRLHTHFILR